MAVEIVVCFLLSGLIAQGLKKVFHAPRPKAIISYDMYQHFIENITHSGNNSFPSGHTTSAFALATVLCLYAKNRYLQLLYFIMALLVGYSRIYLGQHFLPDVVVGMMIGMGVGVIVFIISNRILSIKRKQVEPAFAA